MTEKDSKPQNGNTVYELDDGSELILYSRVCICGSHFKTVNDTRRRCLWCKAKEKIEVVSNER